MKVIVDEDIPHELAALITAGGHDVVHVEDLGWKGIQNGELLRRASGVYDVLVTGDTSMPYQQPLERFDIAVLQLHPRLKVIAQLEKLLPGALAAMASAPRGAVTIIEPADPNGGAAED